MAVLSVDVALTGFFMAHIEILVALATPVKNYLQRQTIQLVIHSIVDVLIDYE